MIFGSGINGDNILDEIADAIKEGVIDEPRDRACFLYFEPKPDTPKHAQCATCIKWGKINLRCEDLQKNDVVDAGDSCGAYDQGEPKDFANPSGRYTKKDLGFVSHKVRCENCNVFDDRDKDPKEWHCDLYVQLNRMLPRLFKLNIYVKPRACCNLQALGKRNPKRFGPYGPMPDADEPNAAGFISKMMKYLKS